MAAVSKNEKAIVPEVSEGRLRTFFARRWVFPSVILMILLTIGVPRTVAPVLRERFQLGLDLQDYKCLPYTLYLFSPGRVGSPVTGIPNIELERGQLVAFTAHDNIMQRRELDGKRIVKVVAALPGDKVDVAEDQVFINGAKWGDLTLMGTLQKPKGSLDRSAIVPDGKVLLLGTTEHSYDGRYYGFIDQREINARVTVIF